jgi:hypothetical protein
VLRVCAGRIHGGLTKSQRAVTANNRQILCAILNKFYSFTRPFGAEWTAWYIRESSTALIAANLPMTWTLVRRIFKVSAFAGYSSKNGYGTRTTQGRSTGASHVQRTRVRPDPNEVDPSDSQEEINRQYGIPLRIYQKHEIEVQEETLADGSEGRGSNDSLPEGVTTRVTGMAMGPRDYGAETSSEKSAAGIVKAAPGV